MKLHDRAAAAVLAAMVFLAGGDTALAAKRALVIGNNAYRHLPPLRKALGDARAMKQALEQLGFRVTLVANADRRAFGRALDTFESQVEPGDEVVLHYSGHGIAMNGRNYLLPVDLEQPSPGQERRVQRASYDAGEVVEIIRARKPKYVFTVLDACRNNPFEGTGRSIAATRGLARMEAEPDSFILFSAGPGETALDRLSNADSSPTSVFTRVLLKQLKIPGMTLQAIAKATQRGVYELAGSVDHQQFPDYSDRTIGHLTINAAPTRAEREAETAYRLALLDGSEKALQDVLRRFPDHPRAARVRSRLEGREDGTRDLQLEASLPSARPAPRPSGPTPLTLLAGPEDGVMQAAAFSPDGRLVATEIRNGRNIQLWDARSGRILRLFEEHPHEVTTLVFSPDGKLLASGGGQDYGLRLWDVQTGRLERVLSDGEASVRAAAFSADGRFVASAGLSTKMWDVSTGEMRHRFEPESGVPGRPNAVAFDDQGRLLAIGGADGQVELRDVQSGTLVRTLKAGGRGVAALAFVRDGQALVSRGEDGFVKIWDVATGKLTRTLSDKVLAMAPTPDGGAITTVTRDRELKTWDVASGKAIRSLPRMGAKHMGRHLAYSRDGRILFSTTLPAAAWLRDAASGQALAKFLPLPDGEGVAATAEGYIASPNAGPNLFLLRARIRLPVEPGFRERWRRNDLPEIAVSCGRPAC